MLSNSASARFGPLAKPTASMKIVLPPDPPLPVEYVTSATTRCENSPAAIPGTEFPVTVRCRSVSPLGSLFGNAALTSLLRHVLTPRDPARLAADFAWPDLA